MNWIPQTIAPLASLGKLLLNSGQAAEALAHLKLAADRGLADSELNYVLGASLVKKQRA